MKKSTQDIALFACDLGAILSILVLIMTMLLGSSEVFSVGTVIIVYLAGIVTLISSAALSIILTDHVKIG